MKAVRILIQKYVDDAVPGWVECTFTDASGREVRFVEKVPIVTDSDLRSDSPYPQPGLIACEVLHTGRDAAGLEFATISTERPWGVESVEGQATFEVSCDLLVDI